MHDYFTDMLAATPALAAMMFTVIRLHAFLLYEHDIHEMRHVASLLYAIADYVYSLRAFIFQPVVSLYAAYADTLLSAVYRRH